MSEHEQEQRLASQLEQRARRLRRQLAHQGGRGVDLAERIDRLEAAVDALRGELQCPHCEYQLTGV